MLLLGGGFAYVGIYRTLTAAVDNALAARAAALPRLVGVERGEARDEVRGERREPVPLPPGDRYVIKTALGQTIARSAATETAQPPRVIDRQTVRLADGTRLRSVSVEVEVADAQGQLQTATIVYSTPTRELDAMLNRLLIVFVAVGVCSAIGAGIVARSVARRALGPVNRAAEALATIDESTLGRSSSEAGAAVDPANMPVELRGIAQRLREMLARLDASAQQRRRFLADAAHELRTPIAALMTTLEVALRHDHDPTELREMLQDALDSTHSMRQLAEALLEHARGQLALERTEQVERVDVAKLLDECVGIARGLARGRQISVEGTWPQGLAAGVSLVRLRSIVLNLLSNAVTYTRSGGRVQLEAGWVDTPEGRRLRLVVSDDGPGIAAEHLPHLFEPFYRAAPAQPAQMAPGGEQREHHGLGLFLVASHAQAMGGHCQVQSQPGHGARFEVILAAADLALAPGDAQAMSAS